MVIPLHPLTTELSLLCFLNRSLSFFLNRNPCKVSHFHAYSVKSEFSKTSALFNSECFTHTQGKRSLFFESYPSPIEYKISSLVRYAETDALEYVANAPRKQLSHAQNLTPEGFHFSWKSKHIFITFTLQKHVLIISAFRGWRLRCGEMVQSCLPIPDTSRLDPLPGAPSFSLWRLLSTFFVKCVHLWLFLVLVFYLHKENLILQVALVLTFST